LAGQISRKGPMSPERTTIALWIAWLVSWGVAAFWSNRTEKRRGIVLEIFFRVLLFAGSILLFVIPLRLDYFGQVQLWHFSDALKWLLVAMTAAGFLFTWWARIHLGRLWSAWGVVKKSGHHVVESGPYRLVRHPIYSGLILAAFATAIQKGTSFALLGAAVISLVFYIKARLEERFLRAELGQEAYDAYASKTAMLVPLKKQKSNQITI
jgi:protein-S-isoprenylcysteine O-methyltransferase Ste14